MYTCIPMTCLCLSVSSGGCQPLPEIENGAIVVSGLSTGDTATYSCNDGFHLVGDPTRTCTVDRVWSPDAPLCRGTVYMYIILYIILYMYDRKCTAFSLAQLYLST